MKSDLVNDFEIMHEELGRNSGIEIHNAIAFDQFKFDENEIYELNEVCKEYKKIELEEKNKELLLVPNGLRLDWSMNEGLIMGKFKLQSSTDALAKKVSNLPKSLLTVFEDNEIEETQITLLKIARSFDYIENIGFACFIKEGEAPADPNLIYFLDEENLMFHKMNIDLYTYHKVLFLLKGAAFWQFLFFENEFKDQYPYENICRWIHVLPELFPNHDYSLVIEKLKLMIERNGKDGYGWADKSITKLTELGLWK